MAYIVENLQRLYATWALKDKRPDILGEGISVLLRLIHNAIKKIMALMFGGQQQEVQSYQGCSLTPLRVLVELGID